VAQYGIAPYPVPNSLSLLLLAGLNLIVNPVVAGKVFLLGLVCLWAFAAYSFCCRWFSCSEYRAAAWTLIFGLGAFSSFFWYGFTSYQLGCAVLLWFLGQYDERSSPIMVCLVAIVLFYCHAMPFLCFILLLFTTVLLCGHKWSHLVALAPAAALSLAFVAGRYSQQFDAPVSSSAWSSVAEMIVYKAGTITMLGPFKNFLLPNGSSLLEDFPFVYWLGFVSNVLVTGALGAFLLYVFYRRCSKIAAHIQRRELVLREGLLVFSMLLATLCVFAPHNFFGMENPGVRIVLPMIFTAFPSFYAVRFNLVSWLATFVAIVSLSTTTTYLLNSRLAETAKIPPQEFEEVPPEARNSVLAYNDWLYRNTRYRYYNYRVHALAPRMEQAKKEDLSDLVFRTSLIVSYSRRVNP
ncbi:MAG: hypothetical protein AAF680_04735, partial [Pseudomonadota bacterium]